MTNLKSQIAGPVLAAALVCSVASVYAVSIPIGYLRLTWSGNATITRTEVEPYTVTIDPIGKGSLTIRPVTRVPQPEPIRIDKITINGNAYGISITFPKPTQDLLFQSLKNPYSVVSFIGAIEANSCEHIKIRGGNLGSPLYSENLVKLKTGSTVIRTIARKVRLGGYTYHYGGDIFTDVDLPMESSLSVTAKGGDIDCDFMSAVTLKKIVALGVKSYDVNQRTVLKGGNIRGIFTAAGTDVVYRVIGETTESNLVFTSGTFKKLMAKGGKIHQSYALGSNFRSVLSMPVKLDETTYSDAGIEYLWLFSRGNNFKKAKLGRLEARGADIQSVMLQVRDSIGRVAARAGRLGGGGRLLSTAIICGTVGDADANIPPQLLVDPQWTSYLGDVIEEEVEAIDANTNDFVRFGLGPIASGVFCDVHFNTNTWFSMPATSTFVATCCMPGYYIVPLSVVDSNLTPGFYRKKVRLTCYDNHRPTVTTDVSHLTAEVGQRREVNVSGNDIDGNKIKFSYEVFPGGDIVNNIEFDNTNWYNPLFPTLFTVYPPSAGNYEIRFTATDNGTPQASTKSPTVVTLSVTEPAGSADGQCPAPLAVVPETAEKAPRDYSGTWLWWWYLEGHFLGPIGTVQADTEMRSVSVQTGVESSKLRRVCTTENTYDCSFESSANISVRMLDGGDKSVLVDSVHSNVFVPGYK